MRFNPHETLQWRAERCEDVAVLTVTMYVVFLIFRKPMAEDEALYKEAHFHSIKEPTFLDSYDCVQLQDATRDRTFSPRLPSFRGSPSGRRVILHFIVPSQD